MKHLSGIAFAAQLRDVAAQWLPPNPRGGLPRALDLGTGSGLLAATLARLGVCVTATDITEAAVRCAARNCAGLSVSVSRGDLFDAVDGQRFSLVIANPPYERETPRRRGDAALTSSDFLERFGARVHEFAPVAVIGFPAADAATLKATGLRLRLWRSVATEGEDLGLFVSEQRQGQFRSGS